MRISSEAKAKVRYSHCTDSPGVGKIYTAECIAEIIRECLRAQIKHPCIVNYP